MYIVKRIDKYNYKVGHYDPIGTFIEYDSGSKGKCEDICSFLNGGLRHNLTDLIIKNLRDRL